MVTSLLNKWGLFQLYQGLFLFVFFRNNCTNLKLDKRWLMSNMCFCVFSVPGKLKQFVLDLHSGKLHREFHHGPDPTDSTPGQVSHRRQQSRFFSGEFRQNFTICFKSDFFSQEETGGEAASSPPESSFQKLAPSETRYTILSRDRDEL